MNDMLSLTEALLALMLGATIGIVIVLLVAFYYLVRR